MTYLIGGILMLLNWPWTMLVIMPTNRTLMATRPEDANATTRALILKWNSLHAVRTALGLLAVVAFLIALASGFMQFN